MELMGIHSDTPVIPETEYEPRVTKYAMPFSQFYSYRDLSQLGDTSTRKT